MTIEINEKALEKVGMCLEVMLKCGKVMKTYGEAREINQVMGVIQQAMQEGNSNFVYGSISEQSFYCIRTNDISAVKAFYPLN